VRTATGPTAEVRGATEARGGDSVGGGSGGGGGRGALRGGADGGTGAVVGANENVAAGSG
jgi:hypothetical protein